jgi:RecA/RadA recombinase
MATLSADVTAAVASLQARWGAAAPRITDGALALAPESATALAALPDVQPRTEPRPDPDDRVIPTGFAALDAILGRGGLPRSASVAIRGDGSSGRTTLVLRLAAEAQIQGSIVAWLDLSRSFDPVEAVARGVRLEWLVVITPETLDEGLAIGGALLAGRSVDLLVLDLPGGRLAASDKPARIADRLGRLAALARRSETLFVVLEPPGVNGTLASAVAESTGVRLELARRSWIRLGRDIVGQRTEALVARNRYGPPGKRATLRILYADGGDRDACLRLRSLLAEDPVAMTSQRAVIPRVIGPAAAGLLAAPVHAPVPVPGTSRHATPPSLSTAPPPRPQPPAPALRLVAGGTDRPGRPALDRGDRPGRGSRGPGPRRPARDAARVGPSARAGGDVPRSGSGG